jgi:hypothetical protein
MSNIESQPLYVRAEVQGNRLGDEIVFFDDRAGKYFATGPVGADIWEMLETPRHFADICSQLLESYDIDQLTCEAQARVFIDQMVELNLLILTKKGK